MPIFMETNSTYTLNHPSYGSNRWFGLGFRRVICWVIPISLPYHSLGKLTRVDIFCFSLLLSYFFFHFDPYSFDLLGIFIEILFVFNLII
jgi:hypothetical protein